jgi:hypothetical protein
VSSDVLPRVMIWVALVLVRLISVDFCLVGVRNGLGGDDEGDMGRGEEASVSEGVGTILVLSLSDFVFVLTCVLSSTGKRLVYLR